MTKQKFERGRPLKLPEAGISPDRQTPPLSARNRRRLIAKAAAKAARKDRR